MTDEQINVAIHEARGLVAQRWPGTGEINPPIPDYCNDLNAIRDVEMSPPTSQDWSTYLHWLCDITGDQIPVAATARQRAEAFLETLNKWTD